MKKIFFRISDFFNIIRNKIAFYPTIIGICGFVLALLMIYLEAKGISRHIIDVFPMLMVEDGNTALNVLSTCIGGLISMMVFSFSMVMLLLSQASSNFSPRLLPGLISNKRHQVILGVFMATIVYNIFTLFSIEPSEEKYTLPGFSVLLGVFFTILCLSAFIFFIHNISQSIQINYIMDGIYGKATTKLERLIESEGDKYNAVRLNFPDTAEWTSYKSPKTGYFQNISIRNITAICEKIDNRIYLTVPKGLFVLKNNYILKSENPLNDDDLKDILKNINFARGEYIEDNYVLAFKQITEIAVKAMSPGINDPGTAINAIDYLTELFALRMKKSNSGVLVDGEEAYVKIAIVQFDELLYNVMASLRTYCKHDPTVVQKLIWMLGYLKAQPAIDDTYNATVEEELKILLKDIEFDLEKDIKEIKDKMSGYRI